MISGWISIATALAYVGLLFGVAYYGDIQARRKGSGERPSIYALALAVYCTSWTFYGSVGLSAVTGLDFLAVYLGPIVIFAAGAPLTRRIIRLSKAQNITSIADFIAARYGKSPAVAATVTIIAAAGVIPYIALQLKAVSQSLTTVIEPAASMAGKAAITAGPFTDLAFFIAIAMALFAILFGTRHIDATEHQEGLMLAVAAESAVKLAAFLAVGAFVTFVMMGGPGPLIERASAAPEIVRIFKQGFHGENFLTVLFLSSTCILLLPRQFHMTIVENNTERELRRAQWLFPLYLIAINIFVAPIAVAGLLTFGNSSIQGDMFLLALPQSAGHPVVTLLAFLGGLSAATAMVIVEAVALSIMACNDLVMPIILHRRRQSFADRNDMGSVLLNIRRGAIVVVLMLAYAFYRLVGDSEALAFIGLLSFAAIAQFVPAFFGGLVWRRATAKGAIAGILSGFAVWAYTLLLPYFIKAGLLPSDILQTGPWGLAFLRPQMLFYLNFAPLTHGVVWSIFVNLLVYVTVSALRAPKPIERLQANIFIEDEFARAPAPAFRPWRTSITVEELTRTVARYLGEERARRSFSEYAENNAITLTPKAEADVHLLRFTEKLLASAIGAASSRLVMSLTLRRHNVGMKSALRLLDDASEAIQYNRELLQSALDQAPQGIAVFDKDLQLVCWNRQFREVLRLPARFARVGATLDEIVRHTVRASQTGSGARFEDVVSDRIRKYIVTMETFQEKLDGGRRAIEVRTDAMPQGGVVATYTDITERVTAAEALARANENLERRVRERTAELTAVNRQLAEAKAKADEANLDKTRFLAAASHDILQPLNAARLYATSLAERRPDGELGRLSRNIDASLEAVEEILNALLDISRLDTGALRQEISVFCIDEILQQLKVEFEPIAQARGLRFTVMRSGLLVRSDRRLLRRVLQNLVSNAIKYTESGRVVLGCRRRNGAVLAQVHDTGPGIPKSQQALIFKEFQRLDGQSEAIRGLGLGLSIVERICRMLEHKVTLTSVVGSGSAFCITLPMADAKEAAASLTKKPVIQMASSQLAGLTVLCVDNEPAILDGMAALLGSWNCSVLKAAGWEEAVAVTIASDRAPDAILADYHLEHGTGLDVIAAVRARMTASLNLKHEAETLGVIITADRTVEIEEKVRQAGATLLRKPVKPAALRAILARAAIRQRAAE
jgi:Na+/proline symporter/signal transduction histidine kinase